MYGVRDCALMWYAASGSMAQNVGWEWSQRGEHMRWKLGSFLSLHK